MLTSFSKVKGIANSFSMVKGVADAQVLPFLKYLDSLNTVIPTNLFRFSVVHQSINVSIPLIQGVTAGISLDFKKLLELSVKYGYVGVYAKLLEFSVANCKLKLDFKLIKSDFKKAISFCTNIGNLKLADGLIDCALLNTNLCYLDQKALLEYKASYATIKVGSDNYVLLQTTQFSDNPLKLNVETFKLEKASGQSSQANQSEKHEDANVVLNTFSSSFAALFKRKRTVKSDLELNASSSTSAVDDDASSTSEKTELESPPIIQSPQPKKCRRSGV